MKKFKSRKFIMAALGVISGCATVISGVGGTVGLVAGIVVIATSTATYIYAEGKIDEAGLKLTVDSVKQIIDLINDANDDKE